MSSRKFDINDLLEKTENFDKDERYMATNDICTALSDGVKIDSTSPAAPQRSASFPCIQCPLPAHPRATFSARRVRLRGARCAVRPAPTGCCGAPG